jgi:hypothetical protein
MHPPKGFPILQLESFFDKENLKSTSKQLEKRLGRTNYGRLLKIELRHIYTNRTNYNNL